MIRKKNMHLDFKNGSLKRVFYINVSPFPTGSEAEIREEMEWFMRQVQMSLRIPVECFENVPANVQVR